ncbi:tRNA ligase 1 [Vitis vinifera]|uniref:tRNA ligase 1 n=1 Tax=Vitis vinifera TaxID=29760 RepID=A0A438F9Y0_VITVI|nr:tRNA ligase 1 [Vitis vinifera]
MIPISDIRQPHQLLLPRPDRSTRKTIGIGRESQGLYHLTSPSSPATCISTDAPLLIHSRLGHPSLSNPYPLLHSYVPFRFGGDAVLTTCYLINRMPSSILHDQIPHSLIFPTQPLYFLPRVFGCTCFVHTLTLGQDKLSATATKCIFLGYSRLQKGYRCYSPDTHRCFLSVDVTFFEDSPFFLSSESLPISEVLPLPYMSPPSDALSCPLQVYHRRHRVVALPLSSAEVPDDSRPVPPIFPTPALSSTDHLPIALRKVNLQLDVVGSTLLKLVLMVKLIALRPTWLLKGESGLVCKLCRSLYGLKQSPQAWFGCFSSVVQEFGMLRSSDQEGIQRLKQHFFNHFQTKDLGKFKYFMGLETTQSSLGVVMSQRKYALDILEEIGKLNYLTITRPNISFPVSVVSQFLQSPCDNHWDAMIYILRYIKGTPGQGYCVFIGGNLISWKSKKQDVVTKSSVKAEYRAMALSSVIFSMTWWVQSKCKTLLFKTMQMKIWGTSAGKQRELSKMLDECMPKRSPENQALIGSAGDFVRAEDFLAIVEGGRDEEGDLEREREVAPSSPSPSVKDTVAKDEGLIVFFPGIPGCAKSALCKEILSAPGGFGDDRPVHSLMGDLIKGMC